MVKDQEAAYGWGRALKSPGFCHSPAMCLERSPPPLRAQLFRAQRGSNPAQSENKSHMTEARVATLHQTLEV